MLAAGARAGAAEAVPSLGGEFVDDLESADVGVDASLLPLGSEPLGSEPLAGSDDEESVPLAPVSFEPALSEPDLP